MQKFNKNIKNFKKAFDLQKLNKPIKKETKVKYKWKKH